MSSAAPATAPTTPDPIAHQRALLLRAAVQRAWADRVSALLLGLVWLACAAVGAWLLLAHGARVAPTLLQLPAHYPLACALVVLVFSAAALQRHADAVLQEWRNGWLAALPSTSSAIPHNLLRTIAARSAGLGALLAALPWLLLALPAQCAAAGCAGSPPRGWLLLVALPPAAGVLVAWRCRRAGYAPRAALTRQSPRQARGPERLPALARWQWIAAMGAQRGRAGAWMLAPWLLLIPAGISRVALLVALAVALVLGAMLTAIGSSLRTLLHAAALLRSTPLSPRRFLLQALALPALLALSGTVALCMALVLLGAPRMVPLVAAGVLAVVALVLLVHAALRHQPRRIGPVLAVHAGLALATAQSLPPLLLLLLPAQLLLLLRQALRP